MGKNPDPRGDLFEVSFRLKPSEDGRPGEREYLEDFFLLRSREPEMNCQARCHRFWLLSIDGEVQKEYGPEFYSDCENGFYEEYELRDGTLFKFWGKSNDSITDSLTIWEAETVLVCLRPIEKSDPRFARVLARWES